MENLLVQTTTHGLIIFVVSEEDLKAIRAGNWRKVKVQKWPRLNLFPDEGSDMRALVAALQGKTFNLNCYCDNDKSHGLSNNHQGAARKAGQLPFMNLYLLGVNAVHYPYDEDRFFKTILLSVKHYFEHVDLAAKDEDMYWEDELLESIIDHVILCRGKSHGTADDVLRKEVLEELRRGEPLGRKLAKCSQTRFFDVVKRMREDDHNWGLNAGYSKVTMLLIGKYHTKKLQKLSQMRIAVGVAASSAAAGSEPERVSTKDRGNQEIQKIRAACDNTLVLRWFIFQNVENLYRCRGLQDGTNATTLYQAKQLEQTKNGEDGCKWVWDQMLGGLHALVRDTLAPLASAEKLSRAGLVVRRRGAAAGVTGEFHKHHPKIVSQNERAALIWSYDLCLAFEHIRRFSHYLVGWPDRACLLGHPEEATRNMCRDELQNDVRIQESLLDEDKNVLRLQEMHDQSCLELIPSMQTTVWMKQTGWEVSPAQQEFERGNRLGANTSYMVEQMYQCLRHEEGLGQHHSMSMDHAFASLIKRDIPGGVNDFASPEYANTIVPRRAAMPEDAYQMDAKKASIKHMHLITSKTQKPDWYSCVYALSGQRGMWLINLRYMDKRKCWSEAPDAWLVCLLQTLPARPFLVMDTLPGEGNVTKGAWVYVMGVIAEECAVGWPMVNFGAKKKGDTDLMGLDLRSTSHAMFIPFMNPEHYRIRRTEVVSPIHQMLIRSEPVTLDDATVAVLRVQCVTPEAEMPLVAAAKECFHRLPRTTCTLICEHFGKVELKKKESFFAMLHKMVLAYAEVEPDTPEVEAIMAKRMQKDIGHEAMAELMTVEGAIEVLSPSDQKSVKALQKEEKEAHGARESYKREFKEMRERIRATAKPKVIFMMS